MPHQSLSKPTLLFRGLAGLATALTLLGGVCALQSATVSIQTNRLGVTPTILAYNAGHFYPGSNTRDWWRYSGVNGARVFITASLIEPSDDLPGWGDGVTDSTSFLSRKSALRANPLNTSYINW